MHVALACSILCVRRRLAPPKGNEVCSRLIPMSVTAFQSSSAAGRFKDQKVKDLGFCGIATAI